MNINNVTINEVAKIINASTMATYGIAPYKIEKEASEEAEIDEGGEEITEEDEEKIADAIDTTDLGARADMEWTNEKDERLGL